MVRVASSTRRLERLPLVTDCRAQGRILGERHGRRLELVLQEAFMKLGLKVALIVVSEHKNPIPVKFSELEEDNG